MQVKSFADVCRCKIKPAEVSGAFDCNAEILIPSNWSCENSYWDHFFFRVCTVEFVGLTLLVCDIWALGDRCFLCRTSSLL